MNKSVEVSNFVAMNHTAWFKDASDRLCDLTVKTRWNIKKNMNKLKTMAENVESFKKELQNQLASEFGTEEKSVPGENGDRKVKDEFIPEYQKRLNELNLEFEKVLTDTELVEFSLIDMDAEVEKMPDQSPIKTEDFDMLSLFDVNTYPEPVEGDVLDC